MISWLALAVAGAAIVALVRLSRRLRDAEQRLLEHRAIARALDDRLAESERGLQLARTHLADVAAGEPPDRDAIVKGRAWRDLQPAPALVLWERTPDLFVLDVRTDAEWANGHIPRAHLVPLDELEDRLSELPSKDTTMLVHCASGGRSLQACRLLADHGFTRLLNLAGGMHGWAGPQEKGEARTAGPPPANVRQGTSVTHRGGAVSEDAVVGALRECFDPEIPLNIYDLGLIYDVDIAPEAIAVKMTLTSEACPSARTIPEDVRKRIAALGQDNVRVDVVFDPPWHPSRISDDGKAKLGLA
jgi:metal-sulfur cluster biosynthetic enzyme/rhodanese-related sulfurtransferase